MKPNYIFGLTKRLLSYEQPIRSGWIVDSGGRDYRVGMGTPCLVIAAPDKPIITNPNIRDPRKIALFPFAIQPGMQNRLVLDTHNNVNCLALKVGQETDFFDSIKEMNVGQFDLSKINRASEFVKDSGPLTLLIDKKSKNPLTKDLNSMLKGFTDKFKLAFRGKHAHHGCKALISGDKSVLAITMMDIGQCMPIFDPRKVDGLVVHITTMYTAQSVSRDKLVNSFELTFYFSNHATNLLSVDGQTLGRTTSSPRDISKLVDSSADYLRDVGQYKPGKEVKKNSGKGAKEEKLTLKKSNKPISKSRTNYGTTASYATYTTTTTNGNW